MLPVTFLVNIPCNAIEIPLKKFTAENLIHYCREIHTAIG